jgi:hypothetical protein
MIRRFWADALFVVLAAGVLAWVSWDAFAFRLITYSPGADYWEHTAVLHALLENPWHPRHPLIVSAAGSPRFGPHFLLIALAGRLFGWDALTAMSVSSVLNTVLLLAGLWWFFGSYFRDRRAPLFGLIVFFASWFDAPHFSNVFKLKVYFSVAGYPSSAAIAITLLGLALGVRLLRAERVKPVPLGLFALVWSYVYVTHPLTATMALPAATLLALTEPGVARARRFLVAGAVVAGFCLTVLWPYYSAVGMVVGGTVHRMKGLEPEELGALHPFYAPRMLYEILGLCLVALPVLPYLWVRRRLVFVVLGTLLMALVFLAGALWPVPLGHRYVLLAVFFLQIALVSLLLELTPPWVPGAVRHPVWRVVGGVAVGAVLVAAGAANVSSALDHFRRTAAAGHDRESATVRYARAVGKRAGPDAVVLSSALASWPLPTFGPKIVTPHHKNPLIPDGEERRHAALRFFSPSASAAERRRILDEYQVTHVVAPPRTSGVVSAFLDGFGEGQRLAAGYTLYAVAPVRPRPP